MNSNQQLIKRFYEAVAHRDAAAISACYHPEVRFDDEVFSALRGPRAVGMWRMFQARGSPKWEVSFRDVEADERRGRGHWEVTYVFGATGRTVTNRIDSEFELRDGKIVAHRDRFSFHAWARQALGASGLLLGWTPMLRATVRKKAAASLDGFLAESPG